MDIYLLQQLKNSTYKYTAVGDNNILYTLEDIQKRINQLAKNIFELKIEKITNTITYQHQRDLLASIKGLAQIILLLIKEQRKNIEATKIALKNKDGSMYLRKNKIAESGSLVINDNNRLNLEIDNIINNRKKTYIKAFGYFESEEEAKTIINKEFDDVNNYLDILLKINRLKYSHFDNYDPLINSCQNLMYELTQLVIALMKSEESKIVKVIKNHKINNIESYFLIMDFVNSRSLYPNKLGLLIDNINIINNKINEMNNVGLLCKMSVRMQDEVQGIFIGDIKQFIRVLETELIHDARLAFSKFNIKDNEKGIINIDDSIYDDPFALSGMVTWETRDLLNTKPLLVKTKKPIHLT